MASFAPRAALLAVLFPISAGQVWRYVNFFQGDRFKADGDGNTATNSASAGATADLTSMEVYLTRPNGVNTVIEWGNLLDKGRTFAERTQNPNLQRTLRVYAVESAQVTVSETGGGAQLATQSLGAGTLATLTYTASQGSDITSDGDILAHMRYETQAWKLNYPLLPPAPVIFGFCSSECGIATPGGAAATFHMVCSDGTTGDFAANAAFTGLNEYAGPVCRYEAPAGELLAGHSQRDGSGGEAVAMVSSDQFSFHFVIPIAAALVVVYSDQPASCSFWVTPGATTEFQLQGYSETPGGPGAYSAKVDQSLSAGTIFCCDMPVAVIGEFGCGGAACELKETNILARADPPSYCTDTTTATTATSISSTTTSSTSSSSTATSTTSSSSTASSTTTTSSSSTTSSSVSSTSTTSATSTTSTTTTHSVPPPAADLLMDLAEKWEEREVANLQDSGNDSVSFSDFNITTLAVRYTRVEAGIPVAVGLTGVLVSLPDALFVKLAVDVVLLSATSFGPSYNERLAWPTDGEDVLSEQTPDGSGRTLISVTVYGVAHVNLYEHVVVNLTHPINITMPVNRTPEVECAYWDYTEGLWKNDGVTILDTPVGSAVVCQSTHLSLFAAIVRGFLAAFQCSQVALLQGESILELRKTEWMALPAAWALWGVVAFFALLLLVASVLDYKRGTYWSDEDFLLVVEAMAEEAEDNGETAEGAAEEASRYAWCACCCAACAICWGWCKASGALRDVLDEVASSYFSYFSETRDFIEGIIEGLACGAEGGGGCGTVVTRMMTSLVLSSAQRQAAAAEGISADLASYALEDDDLHGVLVSPHQRHEGSTPTRTNASTKTLAHIGVWTKLVDGLSSQTNRFTTASSRCVSLPVAILRLTLWQHPIGACLVRCVFLTSKMRVLLFMVDNFGAILLSTVFYNSTSTVPSKRNRGSSCSFDEPGEIIGRLIGIATASVFLSSIPAMFLGSLCTRGVKTLEKRDSDEWRRQLRVWKIQDATIWCFGALYVLFAIFFISLFIANTEQQSHGSWLSGIGISLLEDLVVIPLVVAISVPLLAAFFLSLLSCCGKRTKAELVEQAADKVSSKPNVTREIVSV